MRAQGSPPAHLRLHLMRPIIRGEPFVANGPIGLTRAAREHLSAISTPLRLGRNQTICRRGEPARVLYNIIEGTARVDRIVAGRRHVLAFLFCGDLCGLARKGVYVNTVHSVTPVALIKIPVEPLMAMLRRDADLQFQFLCKAAHALRDMQRQAIVIAHRNPVDRIASFLAMLERAQYDGLDGGVIEAPMSLLDIGSYTDLDVADVRRAFYALRRHKVIERYPDRSIRVIDRRRFNRLLAGM